MHWNVFLIGSLFYCATTCFSAFPEVSAHWKVYLTAPREFIRCFAIYNFTPGFLRLLKKNRERAGSENETFSRL